MLAEDDTRCRGYTCAQVVAVVAQHMEASPGIIEQRMRAQLGDNPEPMSPQVSQRRNAH